MAYELVYTSAERGLRPGTRGFCTVAHTRGMPPQSIQILEALSAYKNLHGVGESAEASEPVAWSHITNSLVGHGASVISRVGATTPDHTGRTNKLAHHVLVPMRERPLGGPAWLSMQAGFFLEQWEGEAHLIDMPKGLPSGDMEPRPARAWETATGDAAYAALLPQAFLAHPDSIVLIAFRPGMEMLPLIAESIALLEPEQRWRVTYSTYFTTLPVGAACAWRCIADAETLREARRNPKATLVDLTGKLPPAPEGAMAESARSGIPVPHVASTAARPHFVFLNNSNRNQLNLKPRRQ